MTLKASDTNHSAEDCYYLLSETELPEEDRPGDLVGMRCWVAGVSNQPGEEGRNGDSLTQTQQLTCSLRKGNSQKRRGTLTPIKSHWGMAINLFSSYVSRSFLHICDLNNQRLYNTPVKNYQICMPLAKKGQLMQRGGLFH